MSHKITKRRGKFAVVEAAGGNSGRVIGKHDNRADADKQLKTLNAANDSRSIEGSFSVPLNGKHPQPKLKFDDMLARGRATIEAIRLKT